MVLRGSICGNKNFYKIKLLLCINKTQFPGHYVVKLTLCLKIVLEVFFVCRHYDLNKALRPNCKVLAGAKSVVSGAE